MTILRADLARTQARQIGSPLPRWGEGDRILLPFQRKQNRHDIL
jgi:hypothetical protein